MADPVIVLVYDGVAADEAGIVVEVLGRAGLDVLIASVEDHPVTSYHGQMVVSRSASVIGPSSALVVPGGMGIMAAASNQPLVDAISTIGRQARWLGATSTGSVLLAAAGLADDAQMTTHWLAGDMLRKRGVTIVDQPFVEWGRILTSSGLPSSATVAFRLVGALVGAEAEEAARSFYQPRSRLDQRYEKRSRRTLGQLLKRKRLDLTSSLPLSRLDPEGEAEVFILDLTQRDDD